MAQFKSIRETARNGILSENKLRQMLAQHKLPGIYSGVKFLVNVDQLVEQLEAESRAAVQQEV